MTLQNARLCPPMLAVLLMAWAAHGQPAVPDQPGREELAAAVAAAQQSAQPSGQPARFVFANREIVRFRATVFARTPHERATAATQYLTRLVDESPSARVTVQTFDQGTVVSVDRHVIFVIVSADVDTLAGERLDRTSADALTRLQIAFDEAVELRSPSRLLRAGLLALAATLLYITALWLLRRIFAATAAGFSRTTERQLARLPGGEIARAARAPEYAGRALGAVAILLGLFCTYSWLMFVLRRFPYTRPWGETLRASLFSTLVSIGQHIVLAFPGLFTVLAIVLVARFMTRVVTLILRAVEEERVTIPFVYPETAQPTRRIMTALVWMFALILSYGYLPASDSEAFKGVSVFVGLIVSLGSTGVMSQIMSGFTITYSRTVRLGDFVKLGDVEGTVTHLGALSTKVKTVRNEEITIPNAVVISSAATNYSRHALSEGVFVPTAVTIGYDVPWRQVHALLLLAASRTQGLRADPRPLVRQSELQNFCVKYTLLVCLEQPRTRGPVLHWLHANIQDAFNEFGVQIMSPHYESDPAARKVVPKEQWYAAPAAPAPDAPPSVAQTDPDLHAAQ